MLRAETNLCIMYLQSKYCCKEKITVSFHGACFIEITRKPYRLCKTMRRQCFVYIVPRARQVLMILHKIRYAFYSSALTFH